MLPQRTWSVQLNLDELNAAWMVLREPVEKADFLDGMTHGLNLAGRPGQESPAYASGFNLGHQSRTATEEYREQQSKNGKLGGRPKKTAALAPLNRRFAGAEAMPKVTDSGFPDLGQEECMYGTRTPARAAGAPPADPAGGLAGWDDIPLAQAQHVNGGRQ